MPPSPSLRRILYLPPTTTSMSGSASTIGSWSDVTSLRDRAAGDSIAGISGRVGLHVVGLGVDHERRAASGEHRMRVVGGERDVRRDDRALGLAVGVDL